jgi:proteic killer suppression protein
MILSYDDRRTEAFARGERVSTFQGIEKQAYKTLDILHAATSLHDLRALPSNNLEMLKGNRKMRYSIRINRQWRICFEWPEGDAGPSYVQIVDYH